MKASISIITILLLIIQNFNIYSQNGNCEVMYEYDINFNGKYPVKFHFTDNNGVSIIRNSVNGNLSSEFRRAQDAPHFIEISLDGISTNLIPIYGTPNFALPSATITYQGIDIRINCYNIITTISANEVFACDNSPIKVNFCWVIKDYQSRFSMSVSCDTGNGDKINSHWEEDRHGIGLDGLITKTQIQQRFPGVNITGKPIKITISNGYIGTNGSEVLSNETGPLYFFKSPNFNVTPIHPVCYGNYGSIVIANIPQLNTPTPLRLDITKLDTIQLSENYKKFKNTQYYFLDAATKDTSVFNATSLTLNSPINGMDISDGLYAIDVYYNDGSQDQLCPQSDIFEIKTPDPIIITKLIPKNNIKEGTETYNITTHGGSGSATLTITGRDNNSYELDPTIADAKLNHINGDNYEITGLKAGSHSIRVRNGSCYSDTKTINLVEPSQLGISPDTVTHINCHGESTGSIPFTIEGGIAPFKVELLNNNNEVINTIASVTSRTSDTNVFKNLPLGTYYLKATELQGDFNSFTSAGITLNQTDQPLTLTASIAQEISWHTLSNGKFSLTASGGSQNYSYGISTNGTNYSIFNETMQYGAATYYFKVTDDLECIATNTLELKVPDEIVLDISSNPATCASYDGSMTVKMTGGWDDIAYEAVLTNTAMSVNLTQDIVWVGSSRQTTFAGLPADNRYNIIVRLKNSPTLSVPAYNQTVGMTNLLKDATFTVVSKESCANKKDAVVQLLNLNNKLLAEYTFESDVLGVSPIVDLVKGLTANTPYNFTITEIAGNGCTATIQIPASDITIDEKHLKFSPTAYTSTDATCEGAKNGELIVNATSGFGISNYSISGPSIANNDDGKFPGILSGNYTVTVTDKNGCTATIDKAVVEKGDNPVNLFSADAKHQSCSDVKNGAVELAGIGHKDNEKMPLKLSLNGEEIAQIATTTHTIKSLKAGNYLIEISDKDGCTQTQTQTITDLNQRPTITPAYTELLACSKATNGAVRITASANYEPDSPFTFSFIGKHPDKTETKDATGSVMNYGRLSNKIYTIKVTDGIGCASSFTEKVPLRADSVKLQLVSVVNASCLDAKNGKVQLLATAGKPNTQNQYTYSFPGKPNQIESVALFTDIKAGSESYKAKVTDSEGCADSVSVDMGIIATPFKITDIATDPPKCQGDENGELTLTADDWRTDLTYNYTLKNQLGTVVSGTTSNTTIHSLKGGVYKLDMVSSEGCADSVDGIAINDPEPMTVFTDVQRILVHGQATGLIEVALAKGSGQYSYELTDSLLQPQTSKITQSVLSFPKLPAGTYQLKVGDKNQCLYFTDKYGQPDSLHTQPIDVEEPALALGLSVAKKDITCNGSEDGSIIVTGVGGWSNDGYSYRIAPTGASILPPWSPSNSFKITAGGSYTVMVKNMVGVGDISTANVEVTIDEPLPFSLTTPITKDATCVGLDNGWVKTSPINGIPSSTGFTYKLLTDKGVVENTKDVAGNYHYGKLPKGSYQLQVTDSHQCTFTTPLFSIGQPAPVTTTKANNYIRRFGDASGQFSATLAGGSNHFAYNLYKDNQSAAIEQGFTTGTVAKTGLSAGIYRLEIKDTANCNYGGAEWMVHQFDIKQPLAAITLDTQRVKPVMCYGQANGEIDIAATGGWGDYRYSLNNGVYTTKWDYKGLPTGTYSFMAKDSAGIEAPLVVELHQPELLTASITATDHVKCFDNSTGRITLDIKGGNGGYSVSTDNTTFVPGNIASGLKAGSYTITVNDRKGCSTSTALQTITQPDNVTNTSLLITKSLCKNREGAIQAAFTGGTGTLNYNWSYNDGGVKLDDIAYYTEVGSFASPSITKLYSGGYNLLVTDANNCPFAFNFNVDDISDLAISQIATDSVSCYGLADGSAIAMVVAGNAPYAYTWNAKITNHENERAWGLTAGSYDLLVTDSKQCRTSKTFAVPTPEPLAYQTNAIVQPLCLGGQKGTIDITATGGSPSYNYLWETGETTISRTNVEPGLYTLTLTDSHNCMAQFGFSLSYQRTIKPNLGNDANICHYQTLPLDGGNFSSYAWQGNNGFKASTRHVTLSQAGIYQLFVTDDDNCIGADTLQLNVSQLAITGHQKTDVVCYGEGNGSAQITVSPANWPHTVKWSNNSTLHQLSNLNGGLYKAMVLDGYGCSDTLELTINEPTALTLASRVADPLCWGVADGLIDVNPAGGVGNYQTNWAHGATKPRLTKLDQGTYHLTLLDGNGCQLAQSFNLTYQRTIAPQLGPDRAVCAGNQVKLYPGWFVGYKWFEVNKQISNDTALVVGRTTTVNVQVTDEAGCLGTDQINITQTQSNFAPLFLMASSVEVGDTLLLVEVSQPKPVSHNWSFGLAHRVVEQTDYAYKVIFDETGIDEVKLTASNGDCTGESWKTLLVLPDSGNNETPGSQSYGSKFVSYTVTPNPSDGRFSAALKFKEKQDVTFYLVNIGTGQMVETRKVKGSDTYNEPFSNSLTPGNYALFAETAQERRVAKLVVK